MKIDRKKSKEKILGLIEKYESLSEAQKKAKNEADTRREFILPLFDALGWDTRSEEVFEEENVSGKRVDYAFKINGSAKFFLEAKAISVDLDEPRHGEQTMWYAYHKRVSWAVLTDFESVKLYNADWDEQDIERNLAFEIPYSNYLSDERLWLLSKESLEKGDLEKWAEEEFKKPKRKPVDKQLVEDLLDWKARLFEIFSAYNDQFKEEKIYQTIQKFLNRVIFIRVCEDRGFEDGKPLRALIGEWQEGLIKTGQFAEGIRNIFSYFEKNYDSQLFEGKILFDSEKFEAEEGTLAQILSETYKNSAGIRWNFSDINQDVLGSIYEQYLGQSKRKGQGIYYTPRFIVDYIVSNTLGRAMKEKSPEQISDVKILDPACGSGSFLIKAFEEMIDYWEKALYDKSKFDKKSQLGQFEKTMKLKKGVEPLKVSAKMDILKKNIHGVDLDPEAVEVAQLNLLLKALASKKRLINLENIKNGNSLVSGTEEELKKYFGENWKEKKPFDWQKEFPEVFSQGGFDVIIGNPPYIKEFVNKSAFDGLHNSPYYQGKMDIWTMFACVAIDLLKEGGLFSFIAPNNWITNAGASIFRDKILKEGEIKTFIDFGDYKVFERVGIQTMVFVFQKCEPRKSYFVDYLRINKDIEFDELVKKLFGEKERIKFEPEKMMGENINFISSGLDSILEKIEKRKNFELLDKEIIQGIVAAPDKYFLEKNIDSYSDDERKFLKKFYTSSGRYESGNSDNYIFYISNRNFGDKNIKDYPNIENHFKQFKEALIEAKVKYGTPNKKYFYLHREREEKFFNIGSKIAGATRVAYPSFFYTEEEYYGSRALNFIKTNRINLKYLTGILNSKLSLFWLKNKGKQLGDLLQIDKGPLLNIPIFVAGEEEQNKIILLVEKMLDLNKKIKEFDPILYEEEYNEVKKEIEETDKKIDQEVYKLYGLSDEEIRVVEGN